MQIIQSRRAIAEELPATVKSALPYRLSDELQRHSTVRIEEIRLRRDRCVSLTTPEGNILLSTVLSGSEIEAVLSGMCGGSLYAYSETINKGYLSLPGGVRVGICGRAACQGQTIFGIHDVGSLVIRIPHKSRAKAEPICDLLRQFQLTQGVLIYAPPGVGKTTLLRAVALSLASGNTPLRTVVIDTRGELSFSLEGQSLCLDVLSGYPRREGVEIATRSLSAEVILCDEIGDYEEAMALVSSHNCGVPLVASAHAGSVEELLRRTGLRLLHEARLFGAYVGIKRGTNMDFVYDITLREDCHIDL